MSETRSLSRFAPKFLQTLFFLFALCMSGMVAALGMVYAHVIDWTLLGIGSLCLMPVLVLVDILAVASACAGAHREPEADRRKACEELLTRMAICLIHLVTAALGLFLLAVPASSVWADGLTLVRFRATFLALLTLSILLSLQLPYAIVNTLLPLVRGRKEGA